MLKIALSGCSGRMGRVISDIVSSRDGMEIAVGFDIRTEQYADFPIYKDFAEYQGDCDVVIDFSNAALTERLLDYCEARRLPVVICTTGHSAEQLDRIRAASASIPVFRSGNMSIGINLMSELLKKSASVLGDKYDVEIIEKHHNQKLDAPSGTASMLADAVASALPYKAECLRPPRAPRKASGARDRHFRCPRRHDRRRAQRAVLRSRRDHRDQAHRAFP